MAENPVQLVITDIKGKQTMYNVLASQFVPDFTSSVIIFTSTDGKFHYWEQQVIDHMDLG